MSIFGYSVNCVSNIFTNLTGNFQKKKKRPNAPRLIPLTKQSYKTPRLLVTQQYTTSMSVG